MGTEELVEEAIQLLWNSEIKGSENILEECLKEDGEHANANLRYSHAGWLRAMLSEKETDISEAYTRIDRSIQLFYKSTVFFDRTVHAECILLKSLLGLKTGSYLSGAFNLRKGWLLFKEFIQPHEKPNFDQANTDTQHRILGTVAAFNFIVSIIPPAIRFIVSSLGFQADRKAGYTQLQESFHSNTSISPVCGSLVLWIETFFEENLTRANEVFQQCIKYHPNNGVYLFLGGYLQRQCFDIPQAIELFTMASSKSVNEEQFRLICMYETGDCYWKNMEWENSVELFSEFLTANQSKSFRCFGAYQLGIAYCFMGNEKEAKKWFSNSQKWSRKFYSFDQYAARKSKEYNNASPCLSEKDKILIQAVNLRKQGKQRTALEILSTISEEEWRENVELLSVYFYLKGRLLKETGKLEESITQFQLCIDLSKKVKKETYTIPHSMMEIASVLLRRGNNREQASTYLKKAKKYSGYDFDKPNLRRIMKMSEQLEDPNHAFDGAFAATQ